MIDFNLYVITNRTLCAPKSLHSVISEILDVGVKAIQLREKDLDDVALLQLAKPISDLCNSYNAHLFINTNVNVAVEVGAAGVHLPDIDISVAEVVTQTHNELIIGCSVHSVVTAKKRTSEGADFLTYSPIYPLLSKPEYSPSVGTDNLQELVTQVELPVFALGGITPERVSECLDAGASGIAVMSGIMSPTVAAQRAYNYIKALRQIA